MSRPELARNQRKAVIFGATGQLGAAVLERFKSSGLYSEILTPRWKDVAPFVGKGSEQLLKGVFSGATGAFDVVIASGLTDPKAEAQELIRSNFEFPSQLIEALLKDKRFWGSQILSLGSIHETFDELAQKNAYLSSKVRLAQWIEKIGPEAYGRVLHLRLHTLYGGKPQPRMFLGQMIDAIQARREFKMSSGDQLREYMHVEDFAVAVQAIFSQVWNFGFTLNLNTGESVRLADLARAVFDAVGAPELLKVGAIGAALGENRDRKFERTNQRLLPRTRPSLENIIHWVKTSI